MSQLLIKLNDVSLAEGIAIRQRLDEQALDYYETSSGNWGVSVAGIWINDDAQMPAAAELLKQHHLDWAENHQPPPAPSLWQHLKQQPLKVVGLTLLLLAIVYLSIAPFIGLI